MLTKSSTLAEAHQFLNENAETGTICPCCNRTVKFYKRKLNSGMARVLIELFRVGVPINVKDHLRLTKMKNNHDWTLLKFWGLIDEHINPENDQKNTGVWSITPKGISFVHGVENVNKYIILYNQEKIGQDGDAISIEEALGDSFSYTELMNELKQ